MADPQQQQPPVQAQEEPQDDWVGQLMTTALRLFIVWWLFSAFSQYRKANIQPDASSASVCAWPLGTHLDAYIHVSQLSADAIHKAPAALDQASTLVHSINKISFGNWSFSEAREFNLSVSDQVRLKNGSIYAHVILAQHGTPSNSVLDPTKMVYRTFPLVRYLPPKVHHETRNLITGEVVAPVVKPDIDVKEGLSIGHWHPNLTMHLIQDTSPIPLQHLTHLPHLAMHTQFTNSTRREYLPILYLNDFWIMQDDLLARPINSTVTHLPLYLEFSPMSLWKFQMMIQMDMSFQMQTQQFGIAHSEIDTIKHMFFDTNPYLLAVTMIVSLLHSLFDFLAFKNDIQFWRQRENADGLSLRSIILNVVLQSIIFLYLLDNETSWMILASTAIGLLIEIWKVRRVALIEFSTERKMFGILPWIEFKDRSPPSQLGKQTAEYDAMAFRYLSWICFPLVIAYAIYTLYTTPQKSLYSFLLSTSVSFVYTFGFITSTPQLFINYKLKSVAHMPWRTFTYKALNTVVDDLFAFVIRMPTMHRLACFRDDVVFLVYLYQKWKYPVDYDRVNEFGQGGKRPDEKIAEAGDAVEDETVESKKDK